MYYIVVLCSNHHVVCLVVVRVGEEERYQDNLIPLLFYRTTTLTLLSLVSGTLGNPEIPADVMRNLIHGAGLGNSSFMTSAGISGFLGRSQ